MCNCDDPDVMECSCERDASFEYLLPPDECDVIDALAAKAIADYRAGRTTSLRDFAADRGIDLDGEDDE